MAINQQGIAISIKAFLPMGKALDDQLAALNLVKTAHETGDYAPLLAAAQGLEIKTEQKTRRVETAPQQPPAADPATRPDLPAAATQEAREADAAAEPEPLPFDPTPAAGSARKKANGNE